MQENQLAIPFEGQTLRETFLQKLKRKLSIYIKKFFRRIIDICGALVGIIILIPLTIIVIFENFKNKDFGPIFYTQERIGKNGKHFKIYKFRTMVIDADDKLEKMLEDDKEIKEEYDKYKKLKNDPRITKFGQFLRKTSLDEFPQFINVLKGEMTLVGPRPYLPKEKDDMGDYYKYIIQHKPGLTGLWQISGRSDVTFSNRLDMDLQYHYKKNFKNDIRILFITVLVTLRKKKGAI